MSRNTLIGLGIAGALFIAIIVLLGHKLSAKDEVIGTNNPVSSVATATPVAVQSSQPAQGGDSGHGWLFWWWLLSNSGGSNRSETNNYYNTTAAPSPSVESNAGSWGSSDSYDSDWDSGDSGSWGSSWDSGDSGDWGSSWDSGDSGSWGSDSSWDSGDYGDW